MSLFGTADLNSKAATGRPVAASFAMDGEQFSVLGRKVDVLAQLPKMTKRAHLHFCTEGKWSSHEMLAVILARTGPAALSLTSWGLTEDPVRHMAHLMRQGTITSIRMLLDKRIVAHNPQAYQLAQAQFGNGVITANIHAKVMVVRNAQWDIVVITSANMTRNKRIEAGVIMESPEAAEFHENWINRHFNGE